MQKLMLQIVPFFGLGLLIQSSPIWAQNQPAHQSATDVVVIDVSKVFEEHVRFKQAMDVIKSDADAFNEKVGREGSRIQELKEEMKQHPKGSLEFKKLEEQASLAESKIRLEMARQRKAMVDREAQLYYETYLEVKQTVAAFANKHGIRLVQRYDSKPIDPTKRESILQGVNNNVVFQKNLDITKIIIDQLNQKRTIGTAPQNPIRR